MVGRAVLLAAAALLASAATAAAAAPPDRVTVFVHDGPTPSYIHLDVHQDASHGDAFLMAFALGTQRGGRIVSLEDSWIVGTDGGALPEAFAFGSQASCADLSDQCGLVVTGINTSIGILGDTDQNVAVVGVRGYGTAELDTTDSEGWRRVPVSGSLQTVMSRDAQAAGVHNQSGGAEVFLSASAPTTLASSLAVAQPPCNGQPVAGTPGVSRLTLTGGVSPATNTCPGLNWPGVADIARSPTTWQVDGIAAGSNEYGTTRLAVFDLAPIEAALAG